MTARVVCDGGKTAVYLDEVLAWTVLANNSCGDWTVHDERKHRMVARFPTKREADAALARATGIEVQR